MHGYDEHWICCVVPTIRGVEQRRAMENMLLESQELEHAGCKEVPLLGQNIDACGRYMTPKHNFAGLLQCLNDNDVSYHIHDVFLIVLLMQ